MMYSQDPAKPESFVPGEANKIYNEIYDYAEKKKYWFKAFEVLQEIFSLTQEFQTEKEQVIFKFQLILNYLNQKDS